MATRQRPKLLPLQTSSGEAQTRYYAAVRAPQARQQAPSNVAEAGKQLVLCVRRNNPTYGKEKIAVVITRDYGRGISAGTVGRSLRVLFEKGIVTRSLSAPRSRKKRNFRHSHATPWTYKTHKKMKLGERVQVDHMTVTTNGVTCKHFQAWDRRSTFIHEVYSHAKASSAKRFLLELVETCPFDIISIQVDGGSEFMAECETAGKDLSIPV